MTTWLAMVRLFLSISLTKLRVTLLVVLGLVAVVLAVVVGQADNQTSAAQAAADLIDGYGLTIFAPIVTLVLASAVFDTLVEDSTLVYLWLRPVPRWHLAAAATTAAVLGAVPIVAAPLALAALVAKGGAAVALGTIAGSVVAVVGYAAIFVAVGLIARRSLTWGMVYILVWEALVARVGTTSSRLSIQHYSRSVLAQVADVSLSRGDAPLAVAILVPLIVLAGGMLLVSIWLRNADVA